MGELINFKSQTQELATLPVICLDIETMSASEEAINQELELWKPPSNWKPETIEKNREEHAQKVREKSALLDSAPIASIALADAEGDIVVFHQLRMDSGMQDGFFSDHSKTEREMLIAFREWANQCTDENTVIVGFNIGFDLPHLRLAYTRHNLKLPALLIPRSNNPVFDVMYLFTKYFTSKDTLFISLDEVAKRLGLDTDGKQLSGADVPKHIQQGFEDDNAVHLHTDVITYNAIDVLLTMRAFLICTGQSGD